MQHPSRLFPLVSLPLRLNRNIIASLCILLIFLFGAGAAKADPLTISGVEGGFYNLNTGELQYFNLTSNPNHVFTFTGPLLGYGPEQTSYVAFRIYIQGITGAHTEALHITFDQTGGNSPTPTPIDILDIGAYAPTDGFGVLAAFTGGYYENTPFSLAFAGDINITIRDNLGQVVDSFSASFMVNRVIPAPEPATLLLLGTGLAGVLTKVYRRNKGRRQD